MQLDEQVRIPAEAAAPASGVHTNDDFAESREQELEELQTYTRTNRKKWNRDEIAQFRYRMLLRG